MTCNIFKYQLKTISSESYLPIKKNKNEYMKFILAFLALLYCNVLMAQIPKVKTTIIITKTNPYCGGANPPEEILKEGQKKKIPCGEKFYIIKGSLNDKGRKIIDSFVMNSSGKRVSLLTPGYYAVIDDFGYNKITSDPNLYDLECLKKLREVPLFKFEVQKRKSATFSFNIAEPCPYNKPCYKGKIDLPM